jgi:hypothetical protein
VGATIAQLAPVSRSRASEVSCVERAAVTYRQQLRDLREARDGPDGARLSVCPRLAIDDEKRAPTRRVAIAGEDDDDEQARRKARRGESGLTMKNDDDERLRRKQASRSPPKG